MEVFFVRLFGFSNGGFDDDGFYEGFQFLKMWRFGGRWGGAGV